MLQYYTGEKYVQLYEWRHVAPLRRRPRVAISYRLTQTARPPRLGMRAKGTASPASQCRVCRKSTRPHACGAVSRTTSPWADRKHALLSRTSLERTLARCTAAPSSAAARSPRTTVDTTNGALGPEQPSEGSVCRDSDPRSKAPRLKAAAAAAMGLAPIVHELRPRVLKATVPVSCQLQRGDGAKY